MCVFVCVCVARCVCVLCVLCGRCGRRPPRVWEIRVCVGERRTRVGDSVWGGGAPHTCGKACVRAARVGGACVRAARVGARVYALRVWERDGVRRVSAEHLKSQSTWQTGSRGVDRVGEEP